MRHALAALALIVLVAAPRPGAFPRKRLAALLTPRMATPPDRPRPVDTLIARHYPAAARGRRRAAP